MPPKQKPGNSKQDYGTPLDLLEAVQSIFRKIQVDLAATEINKVCPVRIVGDSLAEPWPTDKICWLNPPFAHIAPWAKKCSETKLTTGAIFLLTPASLGSNWYADHVYRKAHTLVLTPRLKFRGCKDFYPKDCMLSIYTANPKAESATGSPVELYRWTTGEIW